jgi:ribose transport system permease protein
VERSLSGVQLTQRRILILEAFLAVSLVLCWRLVSPFGLSAIDWQSFLLATTPLAIAAMAQTFPLIAGGHGLSAGSNLVLVAAIVATWPMASQGDAAVAILVGTAVGLSVGIANGLLVGFFGMRSTVVTVAVGAASMAFALQRTGAAHASSAKLLQDMLLGPQVKGISIWPVCLIIGVCFVGDSILKTPFGCSLRLAGVGAYSSPRPWPLFWAYVFAGVGASIGGVFLAAELGSVDVALGAPLLLQILAAAALGGSAPGLRGGTILGSLLGALIISSVGNLFIPLGIPDFLSNSIDACWLLIGFSLCVLAERGHLLDLFAKPSREMSADPWVTGLSLLSPIALLAFNLRPAASDLATLAAGIALLGVGQAAVLRIGTIDLSMPGLISFSSTAVVALSQYSDASLPYVLGGLMLVGIGVGFTHTWLAKHLGRATIAATLATSGIAQAAAAGFLVLSPAGYAPPSLMGWATTRWLGLPPVAWAMSGAALAIAALLNERSHRALGFFASAAASVIFGVVVAALSGSVHYTAIDTYALPALAAALLAKGGLQQRSSPLSLAIPIAYAVVLVDTALLSENFGYAGRVLVLALAMICGEGLRVALKTRKVPERSASLGAG